MGEAAPGATNGGIIRTVSVAVTVYPVIGAPTPGALKVTRNSVKGLPPVLVATDTNVGAPGTGWGVTLFDIAEAAPVPTTLVAVTVKV